MFCNAIETSRAIGFWAKMVLLVSSFSAATLCFAQDLRFQRVTIQDGLPHDSVYSLLQDDTGFIWLSTESGLCRYDGYQFLTYSHNPFNEKSISHNGSGALIESEPGRLWVGTWGGGLNLFHQGLDRFDRFRFDMENPTSLSSDRVQSLFQEENGQLWVGTYDGGLCRYRPGSRDFEVFRHDPERADSLPHNRVWAIESLDEAHLLVGTDRGLAIFDKTQKTFKRIRHSFASGERPSQRIVRAILKSNERIYVGTDRGLDLFFPKSETFKEYRLGAKSGNPANIRTLYQDHQNRLWIGTLGNGLYRIADDEAPPEHFLHVPNDIESLVHNSIEAIFEDRSNVLWIATMGGVSKTDLKPVKFETHKHVEGNPKTIRSDQVATLFQDHADNLWVGTYDGGLNRIHHQTGEISVFGQSNRPGLPFQVVVSILEKPRGTLWLATQNTGLVKFEPATGRFETFVHNPENPNTLTTNRLRMLRSGPGDDLWIASDKGINRFNFETRAIANRETDPALATHFSHHRYHSLLFDQDGRLWAGGDRGLRVLDNDFVSRWQPKASKLLFENISEVAINCMALDHLGRVWVGSQAGLFRVDPVSSRIRIFMKRDGLPSNTVLAIQEDDNHGLWLATDQGISHYNPQTEHIRNFDYYDGLFSTPLNRNAVFKSGDGRLYFGGKNGFNHFDPNEVSGNPFVPEIALTKVKVFDQVVLEGGAALKLSGFEIPHQKNMVTFEFAALDFTAPEKNRFLYRLEGFNDRWVDAGDTHSAVFTNLHPGEYKLNVRGTNNDGLWNEKGFVLPIRIVPPWWQSGWIYGAGGLFAVLFLLGIPQMRIHLLKRRGIALSKMVATQTETLRDQNQQLEEKNSELVNLDNIVKIINQEWRLDRLFEALLEQGLKLFKNAQYGAFLKFNHDEQVFQFACATEKDHAGLAKISLPRDVALARYASGNEKLEEGVYVINSYSELPPGHTLANFQKPAVVMVMTIELRGTVEGLLLLENYERPDAFLNSDVEKLKRYRDHATSAVAKANLLAELAAKAKHLKDTQQLLMENAHQAGMAEVAANVLHNLGNALNSINTSTEIIHAIHQESPFPLLEKIANLLRHHQEDIDTFFTKDQTGKKVPAALMEVTQSLHKLRSNIGQEIHVLQNHVTRLRQLINAQQEYVSVDGAVFEGHVSSCLEEALQIERLNLEKNRVEVERDYQNLPVIKLQKSKLLRVLIHLINYANDAMAKQPSRRLRLTIRQSGHQAQIQIRDSSNGLTQENLRILFHQNFSGDLKSQQWSLHYCATAATEMGGSLQADSTLGQGSVFTLSLPIHGSS